MGRNRMRKYLPWLGIGIGVGIMLSIVALWFIRHPK